MGDRANVLMTSKNYGSVYLYTHWDGGRLPKTVREALKRGEGRYEDAQYLTRIVFCEMIKHDVLGETGFGISQKPGDGDDRIIKIDTDKAKVTIGKKSWTLKEFSELEDNQLPKF